VAHICLPLANVGLLLIQTIAGRSRVRAPPLGANPVFEIVPHPTLVTFVSFAVRFLWRFAWPFR